MENIRGKLLVSTKSSASGRKILGLILSALLILIGIFALSDYSAILRMSRNLFGSSSFSRTITIFFCVVFFGYPCFMMSVCFLEGKSYCDVYEKAVVGTTSLSINNPKAPMQNFDIGYNEIMNVTESGKTIYIYTQYAAYEILALKNRVEAVREIRIRMNGKR